MERIKNKIPGFVCVVMLLFIMALSGWLSYKNIGNMPSFQKELTESENYYPDDSSSTSSGISASDNSAPSTFPDDNETITESTVPIEEKVTVKYIVINKATNVRAKDSDTSEKIATLSQGAEVEYLSESGKRYQIRYAGSKTGWIVKSCGEIKEKEMIIKHVAKYSSGDPISMKGTKEADDIAAILKNYSTTGASVAIIKNGKIAYTYEYGYANKEKKIKVNQNTKFRVASVTKVFTSMLAMTEVDDGKLDLDGSLTDVMGFKVMHPSYPKEKVTMRMLLTHTSGLIDRDKEFSKKLKDITSNRDFYVSPPGVKFLYCNLGLGIAGAVVEKASDQTISQYAKNRFFEPMGIDASYDAKYLSDQSLVADCYAGDKLSCSSKYLCRLQEKGKPGNIFHLGQGGLLISSLDLAKVTTILMNDGQYDGKQYISKSSLDEMLTDQKIDTGKGFAQCIGIRKSGELISNRQMYFHNGASYGIFSLMAFDPADKSGIVIITSGALTKRNKNTVFAVCDDILCYTYENVLN